MRLSSTRLLFALTLLGVQLGACAPAVPAPAESPVPPTLPTAASPATALPTQPSPAGDLTTPVVATPTARGGQEATDPATVNLAAGRPTLVKFFAYW